MKVYVALLVVVLLVTIQPACAWLSTGHSRQGGIPPHDVKTKSGLNSIYNERVISQQKVTRPLSSSGGFNKGPFHHEGVV